MFKSLLVFHQIDSEHLAHEKEKRLITNIIILVNSYLSYVLTLLKLNELHVIF